MSGGVRIRHGRPSRRRGVMAAEAKEQELHGRGGKEVLAAQRGVVAATRQ